MKKFSVFVALFAMVIGLASSVTATAATWVKVTTVSSITIQFGQNKKDCPCCNGGLCSISTSKAVEVGVFDDGVIAAIANTQDINQATIALRDDGRAFYIVRLSNPRPEYAGQQLLVEYAPNWDDFLTAEFGVAGMPEGVYPIENNGLFKMIPLN